MNRQKILNWIFVFFILCGLFLFSGCEEFAAEEDFYTVKIEQSKLRDIDVLELVETKEVEKKEQQVAPVVKVKPIEEAKLSITLEQSRALAIANNLGLRAELINPAIAAELVSVEEARFEAAFFSNISYSKSDTPTSSQLTGSKVDSSRVDLGVDVPLRSGGKVTFDIADSRIKTNNTFSTLNPAYSSDFSMSISQPLLRGAGKRVNTHQIRVANYDMQITDARTKLEMIRIIAAVDRVYWRLYAAKQELEVRKQEYELAKAQLDSAQRFVNEGEKPLIEVIRAEAGVAQKLEAIIKTENNVRDRERGLKHIINKPGLTMQTSTVLTPSTEPDPIHYELEGERLVGQAIDNRMDMLELELEIAKDISRVDYLRNQALPLVTLDYTYNINGLGPTRSDSFETLNDKNFEDHRFGLKLLVPLGNQAAKSRLRSALFQRMQRLTTKENRKQLIELEVLNAMDQLEANWQRILASRQRSILDGRLFKAEQRHFELGLGTSTDVLEAQTSFADAQSAEILALAEYQIALVDMAFATGTVLGAAKVHWEPTVPAGAIE